jgi:hypothetical protein
VFTHDPHLTRILDLYSAVQLGLKCGEIIMLKFNDSQNHSLRATNLKKASGWHRFLFSAQQCVGHSTEMSSKRCLDGVLAMRGTTNLRLRYPPISRVTGGMCAKEWVRGTLLQPLDRQPYPQINNIVSMKEKNFLFDQTGYR